MLRAPSIERHLARWVGDHNGQPSTLGLFHRPSCFFLDSESSEPASNEPEAEREAKKCSSDLPINSLDARTMEIRRTIMGIRTARTHETGTEKLKPS
jgi:hypothetical protein